MTIRTDVPAAEADELASKGLGRVLYRRPSASGEGVVCDIEMPGEPEADEPEAEPKKRGRPPKNRNTIEET